MTNEEYYKDEIDDMEKIAINKESMEPMECYRNLLAKCSNCFRDDKAQCSDKKLFEWLRAEHKEYPVLSRYACEMIKKASEFYKYMARGRDGSFNFYAEKPFKAELEWTCGGFTCCVGDIFDDFDFVKWEDEEPWSIEELLKNCEVEE